MPPSNNRSYAAAQFALELESIDAGLIRAIEGGGVKTDQLTYQGGGDRTRFHQLGRPKYEDVKVQVGMAMSEPFYKWIEAFFKGDASRKNGAIVAADFDYAERARREFEAALIKDITIPALNASDRSAAYMTVGLAPETVVFSKGSGRKLPPGPGRADQKLWTCCNFRLLLDPFVGACRRVTKVESFTIKQEVIEFFTGGVRHASKQPTRVEFPNIVFTLPEADALPLWDHYKQHAQDGAAQKRFHGQIEALDNGLKQLFRIDLYDCDIVNMTTDKNDATSEDIKQVRIEIAVERMTFTYGSGGPAAQESSGGLGGGLGGFGGGGGFNLPGVSGPLGQVGVSVGPGGVTASGQGAAAGALGSVAGGGSVTAGAGGVSGSGSGQGQGALPGGGGFGGSGSGEGSFGSGGGSGSGSGGFSGGL